MKKYIAFGLLLFAVGIQNIGAQQMLCLDSCRAMALRNNKQMGVSQLKQEVAANLRKSARTKYLPHVSAIGSYQFTSEEVSLLNNEQKSSLSNLGTTMAGSLQGLGNGLNSAMAQIGSMLTQLGVPAASFQEMAGNLQQHMQQAFQSCSELIKLQEKYKSCVL